MRISTALTAALMLLPATIVQGQSQAPSSPDPAPLPGGGPLRTLPHGIYQCALPGDALGPAFIVVEDEEFRIFTASRYENKDGVGTYIMRGDALTFTAGPKKGERFKRIGTNQVRRINSDGEAGDLLCTRMGSR